MKISMKKLRKWRDNLRVDTRIITREAVKGIITKIIDEKNARIMFGKCHETNCKIEDIFPIKWEDIIISWVTKKHGRETDIPIG